MLSAKLASKVFTSLFLAWEINVQHLFCSVIGHSTMGLQERINPIMYYRNILDGGKKNISYFLRMKTLPIKKYENWNRKKYILSWLSPFGTSGIKDFGKIVINTGSLSTQCLELQLKDSFLNEHEDSRDTHITWKYKWSRFLGKDFLAIFMLIQE